MARHTVILRTIAMTLLARASFVSLLLAATALAEEKAAGLPKSSPLMPTGVPIVQTNAAAERIEFAGVSSIGKKDRPDLL